MYHYELIRKDTYQFVTDTDITYTVLFEQTGEIQLESHSIFLCEISFYNGGAIGSYDQSVSDTILKILADTLKNRNILYYIAGSDHRTSSESRSRLFDRWNRNSDFEDYSYINIDFVISEFDFTMYRGLVLHNSLISYSETIIESINDITLT